MQEKVTKILFALLRSAMTGQEITAEERNLYGEEILSPLFSLAKKHDMAHLAAVALEKNSLLDKNNSLAQAFLQEQMKAVYRYEQLNYELNELCETLENAKIPFIPLKGSVIRKYYPEPWMRTSCDIDILIKEDDLDKALKVLIEELDYKEEGKRSHDVSLFSSSNVHIELHYSLIEEDVLSKADEPLKDIWNYITAKEGYSYHKLLTNEMFYYYHIAHMAKHYVLGGCGIRPFLDLVVINQNLDLNKEKKNGLLALGGLDKFAKQVENLASVWFDDKEYTAFTKQMEDYLLKAGVYGNIENKVAIQQVKKGGKFKYLFQKIWLPYNVIKFHYPSLERYKWLLPFYQVRRWFKLLFKGGVKRSVNEIKATSSVSKQEKAFTQNMIEQLGLE